jgi:hypothetical protein
VLIRTTRFHRGRKNRNSNPSKRVQKSDSTKLATEKFSLETHIQQMFKGVNVGILSAEVTPDGKVKFTKAK